MRRVINHNHRKPDDGVSKRKLGNAKPKKRASQVEYGKWNNKDVDFDAWRPSLSMVKVRIKVSSEGKLFLEFLPFFYNPNYALKFKIELFRRKHPWIMNSNGDFYFHLVGSLQNEQRKHLCCDHLNNDSAKATRRWFLWSN